MSEEKDVALSDELDMTGDLIIQVLTYLVYLYNKMSAMVLGVNADDDSVYCVPRYDYVELMDSLHNLIEGISSSCGIELIENTATDTNIEDVEVVKDGE